MAKIAAQGTEKSPAPPAKALILAVLSQSS